MGYHFNYILGELTYGTSFVHTYCKLQLFGLTITTFDLEITIHGTSS